MTVALRQTAALFVDAYRELNAKKLFWVTLILSGLIVAIFAGIGYGDHGLSFFGWRLAFIPINPDILKPEVLYKAMFSNLGIRVWLSWVATILALISTAGFIPDMISGGSIETVLSKPIGRVRLFLTKYATGLLFVALQVAVFSAGCFLVFGLRASLWEPGIFLAVPIVVVFYSYLFAVCALLGLLTRSTITALLLTGLFWAMLFVVNTADGMLVMFREMTRATVQAREDRIARMEQGTVGVIRNQRGDPEYVPTPEEIEATNFFLPAQRTRLAEERRHFEQLDFWTNLVVTTKTVLPKTTETIGLLERHLIDLDDLPTDNDAGGVDVDVQQDPEMTDEERERIREEAERRTTEVFRDRSLLWIVGTSLGFEAAVLALACAIFARRDF